MKVLNTEILKNEKFGEELIIKDIVFDEFDNKVKKRFIISGNNLVDICTPKYEPILNSDLVSDIIEVLNKNNLSFSYSIKVNNRNFKFYNEFVIDTKFNIDNFDYKPQIIITNSYNRTLGISLMYGFIKEYCLNGVVIGEWVGKTYTRHLSVSGYRVKEFLNKEFKKLDLKFAGVIEFLNKVKDVRFFDNKEQFKKFLKQVKISRKYKDAITNEYFGYKKYNVLGFIDAVSYITTHKIDNTKVDLKIKVMNECFKNLKNNYLKEVA